MSLLYIAGCTALVFVYFRYFDLRIRDNTGTARIPQSFFQAIFDDSFSKLMATAQVGDITIQYSSVPWSAIKTIVVIVPLVAVMLAQPQSTALEVSLTIGTMILLGPIGLPPSTQLVGEYTLAARGGFFVVNLANKAAFAGGLWIAFKAVALVSGFTPDPSRLLVTFSKVSDNVSPSASGNVSSVAWLLMMLLGVNKCLLWISAGLRANPQVENAYRPSSQLAAEPKSPSHGHPGPAYYMLSRLAILYLILCFIKTYVINLHVAGYDVGIILLLALLLGRVSQG
jgi:hypothetical protein